MNLETKVVMITGASRGLGKELAIAFAKQGCSIAICARNVADLMKVKQEVERLHVPVLAMMADVSVYRDVEKFVTVAEETFGRVDVLVNNASILGPSPIPLLLDYPSEDFLEVLRVNVMNPFLVTKRVLPSMLRRNEGSIINVTSEAGHQGYEGWGAYGVSKFALEGLTETWAEEVSHSKVRINMVDPGEMDTHMHALAVPECDYELASPADVVDVFLYLASAGSTENGQRFRAQEWQDGEANEF